MSSLHRAEKQLACLRCGEVIGSVLYRPLAWTLTITAPDGRELVPELGWVHVRLAEQALAHATTAGEQGEAAARLAYARRQLGERMYDLPCPQGHHTLAVAPQISRAIRRATSDTVALQGQFG